VGALGFQEAKKTKTRSTSESEVLEFRIAREEEGGGGEEQTHKRWRLEQIVGIHGCRAKVHHATYAETLFREADFPSYTKQQRSTWRRAG
jgi:hypothetical protein